MKKLILMICAVLMLAGCAIEIPKKYTLVYEVAASTEISQTIYIEEYDMRDRCVGMSRIEEPKTGTVYEFDASPYAEYVIVRLEWEGLSTGEEYTYFVANIFYLTEFNTIITLDGKTMVNEKRP